MMFLLWLLMGTGTYLTWTGITGRSPSLTVSKLLKGEPIPERNSWMDIREKGITPGRIPGAVADAINGGGYSPEKVQSKKGDRGSVVAFAQAQLGERYVYGASGPETWDCSGLTMRAYQTVGVSLPHNAAMQQLRGTRVSSPGIGDLVFWGAVSGHVGIYIGNGQIIHAPQPGDVVKVSPLWDLGSINYRSYLP